MKRFVAIALVKLLFLGCAFGSEEGKETPKLVIDVYSVKSSDVMQQKGFALWAKSLREGKASLTQYPKILHAEYPLGGAFDISNEGQAEDDSPKLVVTGHVAPRVEKGAYKITFSQIGRPPSYSSETELTIRQQDRRVLMLPAIDLGLDGILETVVLIQFKIKDKDDGETSRFEIN